MTPTASSPAPALADIAVTTIDGAMRPFRDFMGRKATLVVNVASQCGFTPQYEGLQKLHQQYHAQGLAVLGFPCNQFGQQEPGDAEEIKRFCSLQYQVTFPLFAKIDVNGKDAHPLYEALKAAAPGLLGTEAIKWNFTKFLLNHEGRVLSRHAPNATPESLADIIVPLLS